MYYYVSTENHQRSVKGPAETKIGKLVVKNQRTDSEIWYIGRAAEVRMEDEIRYIVRDGRGWRWRNVSTGN